MPFSISHHSSSYKKLDNPSRSNSVTLLPASSTDLAARSSENPQEMQERHQSSTRLSTNSLTGGLGRPSLLKNDLPPLPPSDLSTRIAMSSTMEQESGFREFSPLTSKNTHTIEEEPAGTQVFHERPPSDHYSRRVSMMSLTRRQVSQPLLEKRISMTGPSSNRASQAEMMIKKHISRLGTMSSLHPEPIFLTEGDEEALLDQSMPVAYSTDCLKQPDDDVEHAVESHEPEQALEPLTFGQKIQKQIGLICMILSTVVFCLLGMAVKAISLSNQPVPTMQIIVVRGLLGWLITVGMMWYRGIPNMWFGPPGCRSLLFARGILGFISLSFGWWTLTVLSVADATVIGFLAPVFTGILGRIFLNEPWEVSDAIAAGVSLTGVIFIARPTCIFGNMFQKKGRIVPSVFPGSGSTTEIDLNETQAIGNTEAGSTIRQEVTVHAFKAAASSPGAPASFHSETRPMTQEITIESDRTPENIAYHVLSSFNKRSATKLYNQPSQSAIDYVGGLLPGELSQLSKRNTILVQSSNSSVSPAFIDAYDIDYEAAVIDTASSSDSTVTLANSLPSSSSDTADDALRLAGVVSGLASAVFVALALIVIRKLSSRTNTLHVVSTFHLLSVPFALIMTPLLPKVIEPRPWISPAHFTVSTWCLLTSTAISGLAGQMLMSVGLAREKAGKAASMNYIQAVFAFFFEWVFWGVVPHWMSLMGGSVVVTCVLTVAFLKKS